MKYWLVYSLIRVGLFAAVFALLYGVLHLEAWIAAIVAAIVGFCIAYLFFRPQRDKAIAVATSGQPKSDDELAEEAS